MSDPIVGHHADPLTRSQLDLCMQMRLWIETVRQQSSWYERDWLPSEVDCRKSRLFWRIRTGKLPLEHAPPTCYSCPWYELIEIDEPHDVVDVHESPFGDESQVAIAQCLYTKIQPGVCGFGPYVFRYWRGEFLHKMADGDMYRWYVQRDKELES